MSNINRVFTQWPAGMVATQNWLQAQGVTSDQARKWVRSGWLVRVGHGAYARVGDRLSWEGAVAGLQVTQSNEQLAFWPAGLTALELFVGAHYLPLGNVQLQMWGRPGKQLPRWFIEYEWGASVSYHNYLLFEAEPEKYLVAHTPVGRDYSLLVSAPECAVLEWLYRLPKTELFSERVKVTFESLGTLRPNRVQQALEACRSVQVKRVFLYLAREFDHSWYHRLSLGLIDLGRGKRQLYPDGRLDREFLITVPERFNHGV